MKIIEIKQKKADYIKELEEEFKLGRKQIREEVNKHMANKIEKELDRLRKQERNFFNRFKKGV